MFKLFQIMYITHTGSRLLAAAAGIQKLQEPFGAQEVLSVSTNHMLLVSANHRTGAVSHLNRWRFLVRAAARDESVSSEESLNTRAAQLTTFPVTEL